MDDISQCSSCQLYGHVYTAFDGEPLRSCRDCGELGDIDGYNAAVAAYEKNATTAAQETR